MDKSLSRVHRHYDGDRDTVPGGSAGQEPPSARIVIEFLPPYTLFHVIRVSSYRASRRDGRLNGNKLSPATGLLSSLVLLSSRLSLRYSTKRNAAEMQKLFLPSNDLRSINGATKEIGYRFDAMYRESSN